MKAAPFLTAALLAGCGYTFGPAAGLEHRSVRVDVAENLTERRTHEFDLTASVLRRLQSAGVAVNDPAAPVVLRMTIRDIREPSVVEGALDVVTVGSVSFRLEASLHEAATGKELLRETHEERASFAAARGESRETARRQVLEQLARRVVSRLEKSW